MNNKISDLIGENAVLKNKVAGKEIPKSLIAGRTNFYSTKNIISKNNQLNDLENVVARII